MGSLLFKYNYNLTANQNLGAKHPETAAKKRKGKVKSSTYLA